MHSNAQLAKRSFFAVLAVTFLFPSLGKSITHQEVWSAVEEGPYAMLPEHQTTRASFFKGGVNLLKNSAERTLNDKSDVLPWFQKLVHPVGICYSGTWEIDGKSPYTGYFAEGKKGLIIVRASEAMGNPRRGDWRSFGIAGKIFPTLNSNESVANTANFFTVDDLGGTSADAFMELEKTNEPANSIHLSTVFGLPMIATIIKTFSKADSHPGIRPLYPISELDAANPGKALAPLLMAIRSESPSLGEAAPADFRDELRLENYPHNELKFGILVSQRGKEWKRLGTIRLDQESLSDGCDHRLHFAHPKSR